MIYAIVACATYLMLGLVLMFNLDASTDFAMGRDLIARRRYLSPAGVICGLALLWPAGLIWYWRRWRRWR